MKSQGNGMHMHSRYYTVQKILHWYGNVNHIGRPMLILLMIKFTTEISHKKKSHNKVSFLILSSHLVDRLVYQAKGAIRS